MDLGKRINSVSSVLSEKRMRFEVEHAFVNLLDLPMGPLHLIMSKVSPDKQILLRRASKALRKEHSQFMMHKYRSYVKYHKRKDSDNDDLCVLEVLAASTDFFINAGYELVFTGTLLRSKDLNQLGIGVEAIDEVQMHQFLYEFYTNVEAATSILHLKQRRLVYTVTLLNLLRQFQRFRVVSFAKPLLHWHLHLEVCGIFLGIKSDVSKLRLSEEEKLIDFLTILAELLVFDVSSAAGYRFIEIGKCFYIYGRKHVGLSSRTPRINFKLSILAPSEVRDLLENVMDGKVKADSDIIYPLVTDSPLSIHLEVKTTKHYETIGADRMHICILPMI